VVSFIYSWIFKLIADFGLSNLWKEGFLLYLLTSKSNDPASLIAIILFNINLLDTNLDYWDNFYSTLWLLEFNLSLILWALLVSKNPASASFFSFSLFICFTLRYYSIPSTKFLSSISLILLEFTGNLCVFKKSLFSVLN
jgi:hypothetical protein